MVYVVVAGKNSRYILGVLSISDSGSVALLDNSIITWDFNKLWFKDYNFSFCNLEYTDFSNSSFEKCIFKCSTLNYANFNGLIIKSYLQFVNCSMQYIRIKNLQLDNEVKKKRKQDNKMYILELRGVSLEGAEFENIDFRNINFVAIASMEGAKYKNIKLGLEQLFLIKKYKSLCEDIKVYVSITDLTKSEIREVNKLKKDNKKNDISKYVEDKIVKKMKLEGVPDEEILNLTIVLDKTIIME